MAIFEDIKLTWQGRDYIIPPDRVMRAIAKIEDVITMSELGSYQNAKRLPLAKISLAYAAVLRHAGAVVADEEVYNSLFAEGAEKTVGNAVAALNALMVMMIPPEHLREKVTEKKDPAGAAPAA